MSRARTGATIPIASSSPSTVRAVAITESIVKLVREQANRASARRGQQHAAAPRRLARLPGGGFLRDAYGELRKAHWPSREQTMRLTGLVVAISILMSIVLGLADYAFAQLFDAIAT